ARVPGNAAGVPPERPSGIQSVHGGGVSLWSFYARNSGEVLGLVGQHVSLVVSSTAIAIVLGVPVGIVLTRRPAWRAPVLGLANVFQTIPSLALFGFLIPLPFIGGIGATTAIVALVVYALLPIVRNTYTGIAGVDPAVREAGRGMGMTDWQLLTQVELPLGLGVILAGVRVATGVSVGTAPTATGSWSAPRTSPSPTCWAKSWRSRSSAVRGCRSSAASTWAARSCAIRPSRRARSISTWSTRGRRTPPS